jgi:hypothetical protein
VGKVQHGVPPSVGYKNSLAGVLCELVARKVLIVTVVANVESLLFDPGQNCHKVVNSFIVLILSNESTTFGHSFRDMRWE